MSPSYHGNRKLKIEHAVTEAMVQSTFVPSFISTKAFFIVSKQFVLVTGGFFNENGHFSQYAHAVKG
jgi:hypothetical protein